MRKEILSATITAKLWRQGTEVAKKNSLQGILALYLRNTDVTTVKRWDT